MEVTNTIAYYIMATITAVKNIIVQAPEAKMINTQLKFNPGACTIELFRYVIHY
jgi:hypothetical protein